MNSQPIIAEDGDFPLTSSVSTLPRPSQIRRSRPCAAWQICTRFCRIHFNVNGNRRVSKDKHLHLFLSLHNGWEFSMMLAQVFHEFSFSRTQTVWRVVYPIVGYKFPDHLGVARHFCLEQGLFDLNNRFRVRVLSFRSARRLASPCDGYDGKDQDRD